MDFNFKFTYTANGRVKRASGTNEDFDIVCRNDKNRVRITLVPKTPVTFTRCRMITKCSFGEDTRFFANGFQSWTDSAEYLPNERMPYAFICDAWYGKKLGLDTVGDYNIRPQIKQRGVFRSYSYTYVRNADNIRLFGSLTDATGYTIFEAITDDDELRIYKDLKGVTISEPYDIFDLYVDCGGYDEVFDRYFKALNIKPRTDKAIHGYTSWYNYYQNINQSVILSDLEALSKEQGIDTFQIDDGYQTAVGDWLSTDIKKFPFGMKHMADMIHEKGYDAGLWLAPFGAQKNSFIAKKHPNWLIKNEKGKPICVGANWGGFYALNIYNEHARAYIKKVFDTVLNEWGYDLVKLDFLYAASIVPMYGKSRGEIAYDAMALLRECVGDKRILGCGCQMMPAFGKVDYMRIGADMSLSWKDNDVRKHMHREDVSTPNAVRNSIYRRHLDGRAFLNDTDVFLLRNYNIGFTEQQRELLAKFISIFGSVLFMSDNVSKYSDRQHDAFVDTISKSRQLISVEENNHIVDVKYTENGEEKEFAFNSYNGNIL